MGGIRFTGSRTNTLIPSVKDDHKTRGQTRKEFRKPMRRVREVSGSCL